MKELSEYRGFMSRAELHKSLNTLVGLLAGIAADRVLKESEQDEIKHWYALHRGLIDRHPFSEILPVIDAALCDNVITLEEAENVQWLCSHYLDKKVACLYFAETTSLIQQLQGILYGLLTDGKLPDAELDSLNQWLAQHEVLLGTYPFDELRSLLASVQADGVVTEDERNMLRAFFSTFVDTRDSFNIHDTEMRELQHKYSVGGVCALEPNIEITGKVFCFTGESIRTDRSEIASIITERGGIYHDAVTKKTNYLIVGSKGNPCWAFSCYGRKIEKAMSLRKEGNGIVIVNENDFWSEIYHIKPSSETSNGFTVFDILKNIRPAIDKVLEALNFSLWHIAENQLKDGSLSLRLNIMPSRLADSESESELSSQAGSAVLLRIIQRKGYCRIEFPANQRHIYEQHLEVNPKVTNGWGSAAVDAEKLPALAAAVGSDLEQRLLHYPSDFGCCSRYEQCSAAGCCIAPDQDMAAGCYYKRNLFNGKVFYASTVEKQ